MNNLSSPPVSYSLLEVGVNKVQDKKHQVDNASKHVALYNDAKFRSQRQEQIYSRCIDKECTFKPKLITKESVVSKKTVREVQEEVKERLNYHYANR